MVDGLEKGREMTQTQKVADVEANDVKKSKGKPSDGPMELLSVKVDGDLKEQVQRIADQDGKTASEVAREILEKHLSGTPDRQRATLLRSLGITKAEVHAWLNAKEKNIFRDAVFHRLTSAIEQVEDRLKEA